MILDLEKFSFSNFVRENFKTDKAELIVCLEVLSYIENWRIMLEEFSRNGDYCICCLYLPDSPIGYVKSAHVFEEAFSEKFHIIESINIRNRKSIIVFGKSR